MFPIRDDNPQINTPIATYAIIALNVLAWIFVQGMGAAEPLTSSICQYGLIPVDLFTSGATGSGARMCAGDAGSAWSGVLSSMFMHGGWMHLIGNLWFLFVFGDNVEDSMGPLRFAIFYLLCGLCAAAAQIAVQPDSAVPMVGASGAIGGVMGAYIVLYPRVRVKTLVILVFFIQIIIPPNL